MGISPRDFFLARSGPFFIGLLLLALVAFWPAYISKGPLGSNFYIHFHATMATLWMLILIIQPMAVRRGKLARHRVVGKLSFLLAPLFILSVILLAHHRLKIAAPGPAYGLQTYILWLQSSIVTLFTISWVAAIIKRKATPMHARFMVCTGLTLIDPVVIRILFCIQMPPPFNYQWITFGLTDLVLLALIWAERRGGRPDDGGFKVFPAMLVLFLLAQIPALFGMTEMAWWQSFATWYGSLPLT
ncbi:MAG: hypothetical protein KJO85_00435 [Gammaproteobacteria bacterium]|nr:hypothetical protein [Gammaproteobacteria bacterium]